MYGMAQAQVVSAKEMGSGVVSVQGTPDEHLNYAVVRLNNDHTFVVQVFFKKQNSEKGFSGKWSVSGPHNYALKVSGFDGKKASGTGSLRTTPDEQDFSRLSLSGTGASGPFNLSFASTVAQRIGAKFKLSAVEHGTGTLNLGSGQFDLRTAFLDIEPDGTATARLMGDKEIELHGAWQNPDGDNRIHMTFNKDKSGNPVSGYGDVLLERDRRGFSQLQVDGSMGSQKFAGHFNTIEAGQAPTPPSAPGGKRVLHSMGPKVANAVVDSTQLADGSYSFGNETAGLTQARVVLLANGQAIIGIGGTTTDRLFKGTWQRKSGNEVQINIKGGYHNAVGKGNVVFDSTGKKFRQINLNGTIDQLDFSAYLSSKS